MEEYTKGQEREKRREQERKERRWTTERKEGKIPCVTHVMGKANEYLICSLTPPHPNQMWFTTSTKKICETLTEKKEIRNKLYNSE